jgi:hypothetical protein
MRRVFVGVQVCRYKHRQGASRPTATRLGFSSGENLSRAFVERKYFYTRPSSGPRTLRQASQDPSNHRSRSPPRGSRLSRSSIYKSALPGPRAAPFAFNNYGLYGTCLCQRISFGACGSERRAPAHQDWHHSRTRRNEAWPPQPKTC